MPSTLLPSSPRVGVRFGSHFHPAIPVHLDGHAARLRMDRTPIRGTNASVRLAWPNGGVTELHASVEEPGSASVPTEMRIRRVEGDWRTFLSYLGTAYGEDSRAA